MPGILPTIVNLSLTSVEMPLVSGRILLVTAAAIVAAFGAASYRANRRAVTAMLFRSFLAMARQAAELMLVRVEDLAPLLGVPRAEVARWMVDGVPRRHHQAVADLLCATVALRRQFPAQVTRRLLGVRIERIAAVKDARRQMADLSRASRHGHISVTLR